jgi:hypothetical protein
MKQFRKKSRKVLAGFLTVWLSGVALLLFCNMPAMGADGSSCPLAKASKASHGHCDRTKNSKDAQLVSNRTPQAFDCCAFIPGFFDKSRKVERDVQSDQPTEKVSRLGFTFASVVKVLHRESAYTSFRPIHDRIFIQNHVFRI